jgi:predicted lactoylglutathione lyase/catechol 2,3-dioxygenase-like lactoylglutathione lyase family enzyme
LIGQGAGSAAPRRGRGGRDGAAGLALRVDFIAVPVSDLGVADEFYGQTLGLGRNPNTSGDRWVEYETGNLTIALSMYGGTIGIGVPDVDEARRKVEETGVEFSMDTFDSGVCNGAPFPDPDGNPLLLHRRYAPLKPWEVPETDVQRTDFIGVNVKDRGQAGEFYGRTLGLEQNSNASAEWPEFELSNVGLVLSTPEQKGDEEYRPEYSIALRVADVAASMERLRERGLEFEFPEPYDSGVCHMAFFKDPDGNKLMLHHRYAPYPDGSLP